MLRGAVLLPDLEREPEKSCQRVLPPPYMLLCTSRLLARHNIAFFVVFAELSFADGLHELVHLGKLLIWCWN